MNSAFSTYCRINDGNRRGLWCIVGESHRLWILGFYEGADVSFSFLMQPYVTDVDRVYIKNDDVSYIFRFGHVVRCARGGDCSPPSSCTST